jgi:hypothetical protein
MTSDGAFQNSSRRCQGRWLRKGDPAGRTRATAAMARSSMTILEDAARSCRSFESQPIAKGWTRFTKFDERFCKAIWLNSTRPASL